MLSIILESLIAHMQVQSESNQVDFVVEKLIILCVDNFPNLPSEHVWDACCIRPLFEKAIKWSNNWKPEDKDICSVCICSLQRPERPNDRGHNSYILHDQLLKFYALCCISHEHPLDFGILWVLRSVKVMQFLIELVLWMICFCFKLVFWYVGGKAPGHWPLSNECQSEFCQFSWVYVLGHCLRLYYILSKAGQFWNLIYWSIWWWLWDSTSSIIVVNGSYLRL